MVQISDRSSSYGFVAAAGIRRGAQTMAELAQSTGETVELTQSNLRTQAGNLQTLLSRVGEISVAINGVEEARGVVRSEELTRTIKDASQRAVNRVLQAEALENARITPTPFGASTATTIAEALVASFLNDEKASPIARVLANAVKPSGSDQKLPTPVSVLANAASSGRKVGDIFDRILQTQVRAGGQAQIEVLRRTIRAEEVAIPIDPSLPDETIASARLADAGAPGLRNEGFIIKGTISGRGGTMIVDTTDPNGEDTRLATASLTGSAGSDVIYLSGANDGVIRAGAGNDLVVADGNTQVYGGEGDDLIVANYAFGEEGDDIIFASTLGNGGAGNDYIVMFRPDGGSEEAEPAFAFGGEGDDVIIGEIAINADGGSGNDVISLRAGGYASGGDGNDTLSAFADATLEGGAGNDDIYLFAGGHADGGEGDDDITATYYATIKGGKGEDLVRFNAGGVYQYERGDGNDRVVMASVFSGRIEDWTKTNRIEMTNFAREDLTISVSQFEIAITSLDPNSTDNIILTRTAPDEPIEISFTKDGYVQTLTIKGMEQTLGERVPVVT